MLCNNCKTDNLPGAKFCRHCGQPLASATPSSSFSAPPEQGYSTPPGQGYTPPNQTAAKGGGKGKIILAACLSGGGILLAVAIAVICIMIFSPKTPVTPAQPTDAATAAVTDALINPAAPTTAPQFNPYPNVIDDSGVLSDSQRGELQTRIERKMSFCGKDIILLLTDAPEGELADYAEAKCSDKCGSNAIFPVIDTDKGKSAYSVLGSASKLMTKEVKSSAVSKSDELLKGGDRFGASKKLIDMIPDTEKQAKAFSFKPVNGAGQVVYVKSNSSHTSGKLTLVDWTGDLPSIEYEIDTVYLGMDGITENPREGLSATPKGTFKLGFAFSDHSLNTKLNTRLITDGDVWVDDPDSAYYNTLQHGSTSNSKWKSAEDTYSIFSSGRNDACIFIEHNGDGYTRGAYNKGSCMYVSGKNRDVTKSYGDVNLTADQMRKLLSYLDASKNPYIVIS